MKIIENMTQEEKNLLTALSLRKSMGPKYYDVIAEIHRSKDECHQNGHLNSVPKDKIRRYCLDCGTVYEESILNK
ncbi:hypothetical protein ACFLZJ_02140 [Nanoarchaeota archaeon]